MELKSLAITIPDLVHYARTERSIALPDFQRPYEWDVDDVLEMLRTVLKDWPSGSLLVLGKGPRLLEFAMRGLVGAPPIESKDKVSYLVLDGQQRLTSVFQAVTNTAPDVTYLVDMGRLARQKSFDDECVRYVKKEESPQLPAAAAERIIAFNHLYEKSDFDAWREYLPENESAAYETLFDTHLSSIRRYKFPTNELDASVEFRVLVGIFDRLNRQGEPLKTFDLLVARLLAEDFDLRERWAEAQKIFPDFETFRIDGLDIIKLVALEEHLAQRLKKEQFEAKGKEPPEITVGGVRDENVLELPPALIGSRWEASVDSFSKAIRFLQDRAGGVHRTLMPQKALIMALAHALSLKHRPGFKDDLERWVWSAYFTQSYAQGANTQTVSDAVALTEWNKTPMAKPTETVTAKPTDVAGFERDKSNARAVLSDSRRRNTTFLRGLMALLVQRDARDWKKKGKDDLLKDHTGAVEFHHIFPEDYLKKRDVPVDVVFNFTPLKAATNRSIGKDAPSTLFGRNDISFDAIPTHRVVLDQLRDDDWAGFESSRVNALMNVIEEVVSSPT